MGVADVTRIYIFNVHIYIFNVLPCSPIGTKAAYIISLSFELALQESSVREFRLRVCDWQVSLMKLGGGGTFSSIPNEKNSQKYHIRIYQ